MSESNPTRKDHPEQPHYTTPLRTIELQVGENVLAALESESTVAVLTTVVSGIRSDRVVSVPLSSDQVQDISAILARAQIDPDEPEENEPTIGFHVVLKNDKDAPDDDA